MIIFKSLRPGMYIENIETKEIFKIQHMTGVTITLKNMSTGELTYQTENSLKPRKYNLVELQGDYLY